MIAARASLTDKGAPPGAARRETAAALIAYSAPIVTANLLYQAIPLAARSTVADVYDFAETGQFALAFDLGMRAMLAFGSALDVLLFQIAVAAHENHGAERARRQVGRNMAVVLAFLLPACTGLFLVMPSIELLIVPAQYRGPFGHYLEPAASGLVRDGDDSVWRQSGVSDRQEDRANGRRGAGRRRRGIYPGRGLALGERTPPVWRWRSAAPISRRLSRRCFSPPARNRSGRVRGMWPSRSSPPAAWSPSCRRCAK